MVWLCLSALSAIRQYDEDWNIGTISPTFITQSFQPFASMMRIETSNFVTRPYFWFSLSAIRQYDEDWNNESIGLWADSSNFQPFASMMRIETFDKSWIINDFSLSAIRQYDEDWNIINSRVTFNLITFSHSPVWWGLKRATLVAVSILADFQPFASMMRIETGNYCLYCQLVCLSAIRQYDEDWNSTQGMFSGLCSFTFSHSPVWWGLKLPKQMLRLKLGNFQPFASMMRIETCTHFQR